MELAMRLVGIVVMLLSTAGFLVGLSMLIDP